MNKNRTQTGVPKLPAIPMNVPIKSHSSILDAHSKWIRGGLEELDRNEIYDPQCQRLVIDKASFYAWENSISFIYKHTFNACG